MGGGGGGEEEKIVFDRGTRRARAWWINTCKSGKTGELVSNTWESTREDGPMVY